MNRSSAGAGLALAALLAAPAQALEPEKLFEKVSPSVFVVLAFDAQRNPLSQGSGVVIAPERIVTNCHVLAKASRLRVDRGNVSYGATLEFPDTERDLCQLHVKELRSPPVTIVDSGTLRIGQRVYAIGSPAGLELTMSDGLISSLRGPDGKAPLIQTTAPISSGSSGGGLFDADGNLVGITTLQSASVRIQNINFAIPAEWIREVPERSKAAAAQREQQAAAKVAAAAAATAAAAAKAALPPVDPTLPKEMPQVGDTWTYVAIDVRFRPTDRTRKVVHTVRAATPGAITERVTQKGGMVAETEFTSEARAVYRGGVLEVAPFAPAFRKLQTGQAFGPLRIDGIETVITPTGEPAYMLTNGRVLGAERLTVAAGSFDAIKARFDGQVSNAWLTNIVMFRGFRPISVTVWYVPDVKRAAKVVLETDQSVEAYELESYKLR